MNPRDVGRAYGIGRAVFGAAMLLAPRLALRPFLGSAASEPAVGVAVRAAGVRDLVLGMMALHTLDHPEVAPRWQRTLGAIDAVDGLAVLAARDALPSAGVAAFVAIAAGGAATGAWVGGALASGATPPATSA